MLKNLGCTRLPVSTACSICPLKMNAFYNANKYIKAMVLKLGAVRCMCENRNMLSFIVLGTFVFGSQNVPCWLARRVFLM